MLAVTQEHLLYKTVVIQSKIRLNRPMNVFTRFLKLAICLLSLPVLSCDNAYAEDVKATYVGGSSCVTCHKRESQAWSGSHHYLAMQHASTETVLGDFQNKTFSYNGVTSTFYAKGKKYFVKTDGPDGKLRDYEIKYTFGVTPLQQYLIELEDGKVQALGIAWDARPKAQGGQRWYHLYPDDKVDHQHEMHWTSREQNWNYMCAECHSTNLKKNYNSETHSYNTTWTDINVTCEACHGPGSKHIEWAEKQSTSKTNEKELLDLGLTVRLNDRDDVSWVLDEITGNAVRSKELVKHKETEVCARCHSRRSTISEDYIPGDSYSDHYQLALLTDFLYHPDGQIKEEVYVYGSFLQSKMYHKGVTCSDCHDPHTAKLRAKGNALCLQCHQSKKFNSKKHTFHDLNSKGSECIECHMPAKTYMGVDSRRDHSIRIPRPDLSVKLGTPDACTNCHTDKNPQWADASLKKWLGKDWNLGWHFGETLKEARDRVPSAGQDLAAVAASQKLPSIARATAAEDLVQYLSPVTLVVVKNLLKDSEPTIRLAALHHLDLINEQGRLTLGLPMLDDPSRSVRIEAARILSVVPNATIPEKYKDSMDKALSEYKKAQMANSDRPESYMNLGLLEIRLGNFLKAETYYKKALELDPKFVNGYINLADLYRLQQRDNDVESMLSEAKQIAADNAAVHHALGLHYVRVKKGDAALPELKRAYDIEPGNVRYGYVYAVALSTHGDLQESISILENVHKTHPSDRNILVALISYNLKRDNKKAATKFAEKLLALDPQYGSVVKILNDLGQAK